MKEIQTFAPSHLVNAAHFLFVSNMAGRAEKDAAMAEKCAEQVKALRAAVTAEDENLKLSAKSLMTDKIAEADKVRDQLYSGYKKAVASDEAYKTLVQHVNAHALLEDDTDNPPTLWAHTHLIYRRKSMSYTKPQIVAQNSAAGSYAAECPTNKSYTSIMCKDCERTQ